MLAVLAGVFWAGGSPAVSAQEDTSAPTISTIAVTSATEDGVGVTTPYWIRSGEYGEENDRPSGAEGAYGIGDDIEITVAFSESVTVSGAPQLQLNLGDGSGTAGYHRVAGSSVVFKYTVAEGDADTDGLSIPANGLSLNGGSILSAASSAADLSHAALANQENHKVDGIRPRISEIELFDNRCRKSPGTEDCFWTYGELPGVSVEWTERIYISVSGKPGVTIDVGGVEKTAKLWAFGHHSGTTDRTTDPRAPRRTWMHFRYKVQEGDLDLDGISAGANALMLGGATFRDAAGNDAEITHPALAATDAKVDAVLPTVSSIAITSDPGDDGTYGAGDKIEVTATFSEKVRVAGVTGGAPRDPGLDHPLATFEHYPKLELDIGGEAKTANYWSDAGDQVVFKYTVQPGDADNNGISIGANKLAMNSGLILDAAENNPILSLEPGQHNASSIPQDAVVPHVAVSDDANHKVAGTISPLTLHGHTGLSFDEGGELTRPVYNLPNYGVSGTEADVTWPLSGDDGHLFRLNIWEGGYGGTLKFASPPNYEDRADADQDNQYEVTVGVSDGTDTATLQVTVLLQNIPFDDDEAPAIVGTAHVGKTLTVDTSRMSISNVTLGPFYWWIRSDGTTDTEIPGARYDSYTLTNEDLGKTIKVRMNMRYYPRWGSDELASRTSEPTATVVSAPPGAKVNTPATGAPTISGTLQDGQTLTAAVSGIADADGMTNVSYSYQWIRNDGTGDTDLGGISQEPTYTLSKWDPGHTFKVRVSFIDDAGHREMLTSSATEPVVAKPNSPAAGQPTIYGAARVGEILRAYTPYVWDADGMRHVLYSSSWSFGYQWIRSDGVTDTEISGATGEDYTLAAADAGHIIKVRVNFTDDAYNEETVTSEATATVAAVPPSPPANLTVSPAAGELAVSWALPASDGGSAITGYKVQWKEADDSWDTAADVSEAATTSTAHTISGLTGGLQYAVRVIAVNEVGDGPPSAEATGTPPEAPPEATIPGPVSALELSATTDSVTVSWQAPATGDAPNGYIAHLKPKGGGKGVTKTLKAKKTTVTFKNLEAGNTYNVWVRAKNEAGKGERTHASITLPAPPPEPEEIPGPVVDLELTATADSVTVSWTAPATGGAPDGYIVHLKPEGRGKGKTKTPSAQKTSVTFKNLEAGATYQVWARAQNEAGKGERTHATISVPE